MKEKLSYPVLKIENITKIYGTTFTNVKAVNGVRMEANSGEVVLIMGPSGSGKTTLILMAGALLRPSSGNVYIDGGNIYDLSDKELTSLRRHKIGFIFQSFNLLSNLPARDNILVPLVLAGVESKIAIKKATGLLESFNLYHRSNFLPDQLSGGEKQRISIARALANDPKLILADEPTANLDSKIGHEVMKILKSVAKNMGKTVVVVSHDDRLRDIADRVLWLEDGRFEDKK